MTKFIIWLHNQCAKLAQKRVAVKRKQLEALAEDVDYLHERHQKVLDALFDLYTRSIARAQRKNRERLAAVNDSKASVFAEIEELENMGGRNV